MWTKNRIQLRGNEKVEKCLKPEVHSGGRDLLISHPKNMAAIQGVNAQICWLPKVAVHQVTG